MQFLSPAGDPFSKSPSWTPKSPTTATTKETTEDDNTIDNDLFSYGDFVVETDSQKKKRRASRFRRTSVYAVQPAAAPHPSGNDFQFGDFVVEVELETQIVKEYINKKKKLEEKILEDYLHKPTFEFNGIEVNLRDGKLDDDLVNLGLSMSSIIGYHTGPKTNDRSAMIFAYDDIQAEIPEAFMPPSEDNRSKKLIKWYTLRSMLGHSHRVKCVSLSPDEAYVCSSGARDSIMQMISLKTGQLVMEFSGHEDTIVGAHFSPDGKHLTTASRDNTLILWDTVIGKQVFVFEHERIVICCCFSRDGKYVVSGCQDKICRVWSTKKGKEVSSFREHTGIITAVGFAPDSRQIVSASSDKTVKIWEHKTGVCLSTISEHSGIVLCCIHACNGNYIVANDEQTIAVWSVASSCITLTLHVNDVPALGSDASNKKRAWTVCTSCPGAFSLFIAAASSDRNVYIIDPETGEIVLSVVCKAAVYCISSGLDNTLILGDAYGNMYELKLQ